jgi:5'-deoxynucleotidase YfbR-like HD superfamily hydrolase
MIEEFTKEKILDEVKKLQYLYELKHVIRYGQKREETDYTESVAEHIYAMHLLADYFRPLEDPNGTLDMSRVYQIITWHELGEIETGDIPASHKTAGDREHEAQMTEIALNKIPESLRKLVYELVNEYATLSSTEARFVKAIDKVEPLIHSYHPLGKGTQHVLKMTTADSIRVKESYTENYPYIKLFTNTVHEIMDKEGYFWQG